MLHLHDFAPEGANVYFGGGGGGGGGMVKLSYSHTIICVCEYVGGYCLSCPWPLPALTLASCYKQPTETSPREPIYVHHVYMCILHTENG